MVASCFTWPEQKRQPVVLHNRTERLAYWMFGFIWFQIHNDVLLYHQ